jgi:hypothetical protein
MTLIKFDHEIKVMRKLKMKIGKSKYSVLVACRMSNAVNKASYLEIFCCNALSTSTKVADFPILNDMEKKCRKSTQIGGVTINFPITFKFRHYCWKQYGNQQRQANKQRSAPLIYCLRATSLSFVAL